MSEELHLEQKILDMMEYGYTAMRQYPKSEKFALVTDMKKSMDVLLSRCIEAEKKYYKKNTLQEMDVELAKLKLYIRLSMNLKFLPFHKYEVWEGYLVEIGKMLGGWLKTVNSHSSTEHRE